MRLLLVEDNPTLGPQIRNNLMAEGYAVDLVADGVVAETMGDAGVYDIAIVDIQLPQRSGLDVLRNWRQRGNALPVLMLTARGAWHEKVDGFKAGADDYLAKPFHFPELVVRLQAVAKRSQGRLPASLSVGDLTLDEERLTARVAGEEQSLSAVEFRLLRYFMLNPGKVLSKEVLSQHVYDGQADQVSNVIEVHINHLRNKIGKQRIETRRGLGYVLG